MARGRGSATLALRLAIIDALTGLQKTTTKSEELDDLLLAAK